MKIHLIRHTTVDVPQGICYGQTDVPLKTSFPEEAAVIRQALAGRTFDAVFTSPLSRCTALAAFCGYNDAVPDRRLLEMNFGDWEMQPYDIQNPVMKEWFADYLHRTTPNGESFQDLYRRVAGFLSEMKTKNYNNLLVFTHGGVLISARIFAGVIRFEQAFEERLPYGSVITLDI